MLVPNPGALGGRKTDELTRGKPVAPKVTDWVASSTPGPGEGLGHSLEHPWDRPPAGKPGERQAPEAEAQAGRRGGRRQDWGAGRVPRARPQHVPSLGRAKCPRAAPHQALLALTSFQGAGSFWARALGHRQPQPNERPACVYLQIRVPALLLQILVCRWLVCVPLTCTHTPSHIRTAPQTGPTHWSLSHPVSGPHP